MLLWAESPPPLLEVPEEALNRATQPEGLVDVVLEARPRESRSHDGVQIAIPRLDASPINP
ncbi:MAG TPA: hypothetical protein VKV31_01675 [bacterium]|nr:hypothetical protein [bacterium]